jgi:ankyrin repeat protein
MMDRVDTMKVLMKLGANVNEPNNTGSTPLHAASLNGYGPAMELLVERGTHPKLYIMLDIAILRETDPIDSPLKALRSMPRTSTPTAQ